MDSIKKMRKNVAMLGTAAMFCACGLASAQVKNMPAAKGTSTIFGCVQGAQGEGFVLLNPQGSPSATTTRTMTYKLTTSDKKIDLSSFVNKRVEVTGTVSAKDAGNVPAPVPDSARGTGGAGGSGKPGVDNATTYANGVFAVKAIKETSGSCARDLRK